jgi:hypothetical protein
MQARRADANFTQFGTKIRDSASIPKNGHARNGEVAGDEHNSREVVTVNNNRRLGPLLKEKTSASSANLLDFGHNPVGTGTACPHTSDLTVSSENVNNTVPLATINRI